MIYLDITDSRLNYPVCRKVLLYQRIFIIGRAIREPDLMKPLHLLLKDQNVSSFHCYLINFSDSPNQLIDYHLFDGSIGKFSFSKNGTYVNGKKIKHKKLKNGDSINIGNYYSFIYRNTNKDKSWRKTR